MLLQLGHSGFEVDLADGDQVSEFNIGRQNFWPADVGHYKSEILVSRINQFGGTSWRSIPKYVDPDTDHLTQYDLIVTCVDKASFRAKLGQRYGTNETNQTLWLDCGNDSSQGNIILGHLCNPNVTLRLPNVYDLYPGLATQVDDETQSCSHEQAIARQDFGVNSLVAEAASGLIWKLIRHGHLEHTIIYTDSRNHDMSSVGINADIFRAYGYDLNSNAQVQH